MNNELLSTKTKRGKVPMLFFSNKKKTSTWLVFFASAVRISALGAFIRDQAEIFLLKSSTLGVAMKIEL